MMITDKRFILNVGGSRSGKTYSILQYILIYCLKNKDKTITIARKTFPSLRAGAMREFLQMLKDYGIYKEEDHNKTNNIYNIGTNIIQFISIDQSIKLRGLKHDLVFIDEVNEISKEEGDQIFMRTNERILLAQNPSDALHWSLKLKDNPDSLYLHSTFLDNPFLPQSIINQILSYKDTDADQWSIYGLGLPAKNNELVYTHQQPWNNEDDLYELDDSGGRHNKYQDIIYGIDFGFNHKSALVKIYIDSNFMRIWCQELIWESYLTTEDLIVKMKDLIKPDERDRRIYCDSAEPKTIESIRRAGFDAVSSMKEVKAGIDCVKSHKFYVHHESVGIQDELRKYKWVMKGEMKTDDAIRLFDDALCAIRYAVYTYTTKTKRSNDYELDIEYL